MYKKIEKDFLTFCCCASMRRNLCIEKIVNRQIVNHHVFVSNFIYLFCVLLGQAGEECTGFIATRRRATRQMAYSDGRDGLSRMCRLFGQSARKRH